MQYTTISKVQQYMNEDLSAVSSEVTNWIIAASAIIDAYVGYSFGSTSADKYYDIKCGNIVSVDRFTGSATVTIYNADGSVFKVLTEGVGADYVLQPYNEGYYDRIVFLRNPFLFDGLLDDQDYENWIGEKRVKVTANFGYGSTVPEDIALACTMIVSEVANNRMGGTPSSETLGDYSITYKTVEGLDSFATVKTILDHYVDPVI